MMLLNGFHRKIWIKQLLGGIGSYYISFFAGYICSVIDQLACTESKFKFEILLISNIFFSERSFYVFLF